MGDGWRGEKRVAGQATTNAYADAAVISAYGQQSTVSALVKETGGANGITWKVQVSNDGGTTWGDHPDAALIDQTLAASATKCVREAAPACAFTDYKVQVKATVGGSQGTVTVHLVAK